MWLIILLAIGVSSANTENSSLPDDRIVGGRPIEISDVPYQVSLLYRGKFFCGGAIISEDHVLTAAHCTYDDRITGDTLTVRVGSNYYNKDGEIHGVVVIYLHNYFNWNTMENDICLLRLEKSLTFGPNIAAVSLPPRDTKWSDGRSVLVTGWGATKEGGPPPSVLQGVTVPVIGEKACKSFYSEFKFPVGIDVFCAGMPNGGKDSCQGDSGGPAVINGVLAGVVSWGVGCARAYQPGVYTNVAAYLDFIYHASDF